MYSTIVLFICALDSSYFVKLLPLITIVRLISTIENGNVTNAASAIRTSTKQSAARLTTGRRI